MESKDHRILTALASSVSLDDPTRSIQQCLRCWKHSPPFDNILWNETTTENEGSGSVNIHMQVDVEICVRDAFRILQEEYLAGMSNACSQSKEKGSLHYMKQVAVLLRFVQLLLEMHSKTERKNGGTSVKITPAEVNSMTVTLLQGLSRAVKSFVLQWNSNASSELATTGHSDKIFGDDRNKEKMEYFHAPTVASFTIGSILRGTNQYVRQRPFLLAPLWKGICDICTVVEQLPPDLSVEAATLLVQYAAEGAAQAVASVNDYSSNRRQQQHHQRQEQPGSTPMPSTEIHPEKLKQYHMQVKMLVFFVARMGTLLPLVLGQTEHDARRDDCSSKNIVAEGMIVLLRLRGLGIVARVQMEQQQQHMSTTRIAPEEEEFLRSYDQLGKKAENCIDKIIFQNVSQQPTGKGKNAVDKLLHQEAVYLILQSNIPVAPTEGIAATTSTTSFAVGRLLSLLHLFEKQELSPKGLLSDTDLNVGKATSMLLLSVCEDVLFSALPQCQEVLMIATKQKESKANATCSTLMSFVSKTIKLVAATMFRYDMIESSQANGHSPKLHGLLVRWLAPPLEKNLHPLSREAVVSVIHLHVLWSSQRKQQAGHDSPRSVDMTSKITPGQSTSPPLQPFAVLLAKLVLDARTRTEHRRNIAGVVLRILGSDDISDKNHNTGDSILTQEAKAFMQRALANELVLSLKPTSQERKRKRRKVDTNITTSYLRFSPYSCSDAMIVSRIIEELPFGAVSAMQQEIKLFCERVECCRSIVAKRSAAGISILLALLNGIVLQAHHGQHSCSKIVTDAFQKATGAPIVHFRDSLIVWVVKKWKVSENTRGTEKKYLIATVSILRFITTTLSCLGQSSSIDRIAHMDEMLTLLVKKAIPQTASRSPGLGIQTKAYDMDLAFELISLLREIGAAVTSTCRKEILEVVADTFKALLDSKIWPIVASAMTSLMRFATILPSAHSHILPRCVPVEMQSLLQCRLQGMTQSVIGSSVEVSHRCATSLLNLIPSKGWRRQTFPSQSDMTILPGSYLMNMPTRDGRSALVIFPPSNDSIADIKNMLGEDEHAESSYMVRSLRLVLLTKKGEGCRLISKYH